MNLRNLFLGVCLTVAVFAACQPQEGNLGTPDISINKTEMTFEMAGGEQELAVSATRDWRVETDAEWVVVSPESGSGSANPQTVTVSVLENTGYDRSAYLKFTIDMKSTYLTVSQVGPLGASIVYSNNFDKEVATQTYGSDPDDPKWPYLDEFDGWKNQTGKEIARVEHVFNGMSCRNNSNSDGKYSDYAGSGKNNLLFRTNNHFAIKNLTLTSSRNYHISFGTTRYAGEVDNTYNPSEFHVYVSADAQKWVELSYSFQDGFKNGRWDVASSTFTLPEGTATLHLYFKSDLSGAHRIDDLLLKPTETAGTVIDFANGQEFEVGGAVTPPAEITDVTVAEFNEKEVSTSVWYRLTGTVSGPIQATFGNFDLNDNTGKVFVFGISNWSSYSSKVKIGGTVTVVGTRGDFNGKIEVLNGYIEAYDPSTETGEDEPGTPEVPTEPGEYDPQGITWTLGTNAYDKTSGQNAQSAIVNGVGVANLLKIGTSKLAGDAILHVPAGTEKIGFYCVAWNGKTAQVKFSINGEELKTIEPKTNTGAANNAPYTITVTDSDYYVIDMPSTDAVDVKVETVDPANGRALFIKLEANPSSEGGEVTPPAGGDDNQGGTEEPEQPVTPPTTDNNVWKYEFKSGDFGSKYSAPVTNTFNGVAWTCTMIGSTYFGYDNNNGRGVQMGKSNEPATEITLSTSGITGNIKKVVVNTSGAKGTDAKLNAKVGEVALGSQVSMTTTATDVTFEATTATAGVLELKWTLTTAAVYLKSITVYTE